MVIQFRSCRVSQCTTCNMFGNVPRSTVDSGQTSEVDAAFETTWLSNDVIAQLAFKEHRLQAVAHAWGNSSPFCKTQAWDLFRKAIPLESYTQSSHARRRDGSTCNPCRLIGIRPSIDHVRQTRVKTDRFFTSRVQSRDSTQLYTTPAFGALSHSSFSLHLFKTIEGGLFGKLFYFSSPTQPSQGSQPRTSLPVETALPLWNRKPRAPWIQYRATAHSRRAR